VGEQPERQPAQSAPTLLAAFALRLHPAFELIEQELDSQG
jgi:hypothetical protein